MIPEKTVGRLTLYRRILNDCIRGNTLSLRSHELASMAGVSAAQVRRDLMVVGYEGSPKRGYETEKLLDGIRRTLDEPGGQRMAVVGVGNLGRALLAYFTGRRPGLAMVAAFDKDPTRTGRVVHGCHCYHIDEMERVIDEEDIHVAVLAVPAVAAQKVTDKLVRCGIRGLLNFAPVPVHVPASVYLDDIDLTMALEKVAFFARDRGNAGVFA
ncbi:MAG: redox-sensing transcriptional repressor Rex [Phycisphaerae bacterium]|nr:redox-sensing transcriptional repressor Rex [Phycisphaerae bacterium]